MMLNENGSAKREWKKQAGRATSGSAKEKKIAVQQIWQQILSFFYVFDLVLVCHQDYFSVDLCLILNTGIWPVEMRK